MRKGSKVKILHYLHGLPPVRDGGLVKYVLDLVQGECELGNDVQLIVPDSFSSRSKRQTEIISKIWKHLLCHYIINPLPVTEGRRIERTELLLERRSFEVFFSFLKRNSPDIIHMHSLMGIESTFLDAAKKLKIPVVFTTHDYYGLCPKINLFGNGKICEQLDWQRCASCMGTVVTEKKILWQHSKLYSILKSNKVFQWLEYSPKLLPFKIYAKSMLKKNKDTIRSLQGNNQNEITLPECQSEEYELLHEYYLQMYDAITYFHFNSRQSRSVFESYLGNVRGEVIPITNRKIKDNRKIYNYSGKLKIGYLAGGQQFKGYQYLKEVLDTMYEAGMTDFECHVYFNSPDLNCPYLYCHGPYQEEDMKTVFQNMDVLVVPSLWRETFGLVVLEALSYGVPVILSSNVGAKELLEENQEMGVVIDINESREKMQDVLEKIYYDRNILSRMNRKICEWDHEWNFDKHVAKIIDMYGRLCSDRRMNI